MFDKSKKKYLKKITRLNRFQDPYTEKSFKKIKRLKSLQKRRRVFRTHASICDGAFLRIYLTALYFCNMSSIIDLRLGYVQASENIEILKVKLRQSKSSRLLRRIAFLVSLEMAFMTISWMVTSWYFIASNFLFSFT